MDKHCHTSPLEPTANNLNARAADALYKLLNDTIKSLLSLGIEHILLDKLLLGVICPQSIHLESVKVSIDIGILKDEFDPNGNHDYMEIRLQDLLNDAANIRSCDKKNNKIKYFYQKGRGGEAYNCI